jgi:hypothetical protein
MSDRRDGAAQLRAAAAGVVVFVAVAAAVQSFTHITGLGRTHGQIGLDPTLLALSVDGLIVAMSLVILHEARRGRRAPALAYVMLWAGIGATVAANVIFGLPYGLVGCAVSAWPAIAFVGAVHVVMNVARSWSAATDTTTAAKVAASSAEAARLAYAASAEAASPLSERALADRFGIPRTQAKKIRAELNGNAHV